MSQVPVTAPAEEEAADGVAIGEGSTVPDVGSEGEADGDGEAQAARRSSAATARSIGLA
jgi:hypothetical protein